MSSILTMQPRSNRATSVMQKTLNLRLHLNLYIVEEDMASLGIQSGSYTLSASSTKRIRISWNNYYYYSAGNARLYGSSSWMPYNTRLGEYLEVRRKAAASSIVCIVYSKNALI